MKDKNKIINNPIHILWYSESSIYQINNAIRFHCYEMIMHQIDSQYRLMTLKIEHIFIRNKKHLVFVMSIDTWCKKKKKNFIVHLFETHQWVSIIFRICLETPLKWWWFMKYVEESSIIMNRGTNMFHQCCIIHN